MTTSRPPTLFLATALLALLTLLVSGACHERRDPAPLSRAAEDGENARVGGASSGDDDMPDRIERTDAEWRERLTPEQYRIVRGKGTERPFTGEYVETTEAGTYRCVACGLELFRSESKFDAGCGWPSFTEPSRDAHVEETIDTSHGMVRTEVTCRRCGAHLGHVFDDGPGPSGQRYCINSVSLDLAKDGASPTRAEGSPDAEDTPR